MRKFSEFIGHPLSFADAQGRGLWRGVFQYAQDGDTIGVLFDKGHYDLAQHDVRVDQVDTHEIVGEHRADGLRAGELARTTLGLHPFLALRSLQRRSGEGETYSGTRFVHDVWLWRAVAWVNYLEMFVGQPDMLAAPLGEIRPFPAGAA